jgi:hypothetical protein
MHLFFLKQQTYSYNKALYVYCFYFNIIVQAKSHQTIHIILCTALISKALALISNWQCIAWHPFHRTLIVQKLGFATSELRPDIKIILRTDIQLEKVLSLVRLTLYLPLWSRSMLLKVASKDLRATTTWLWSSLIADDSTRPTLCRKVSRRVRDTAAVYWTNWRSRELPRNLR